MALEDSSFQDCQVSCLLTEDCQWFSYGKLTENCLIFKTCPTLDESQTTYETNSRSCVNVTEKSM